MADPRWILPPARTPHKYGTSDPVGRALELGQQGPAEDPTVQQMARNRRVNARQAAAMQKMGRQGGGSSINYATGKPDDPMFYWQQNNLPYRVWEPKELEKLRAYCRLLYLTHPVLASAIDIYSKYPLTGMELTDSDPALVDFYSTQFFDGLHYDTTFLKQLGREYWTAGEAWPLGSFNDVLGVWEADELLNADSVEVHRSPFLREPYFYIKLPEHIRKVLTERKPVWEYETLVRDHPELLRFATDEKAMMPVSSILLRQSKFDADTFNPRGIPILLRGLRAVVQEEKLNAAQDAVADRLYTPLVLAKLGASASDLGTNSPWIPTDGDLEEFEIMLDAALSADFRVITYNFAVEMDTVFGREVMPDFNSDFERLTDRQLQIFGLSRTMLTGAGAGETYAADAINRDLVTQLLTDYQDGVIKQHYKDRALVVAEAQGHFAYETRGGTKYPVMEEAVEVDPVTGDYIIIEQPKLKIPEMRIKAMNFSDEKEQRAFIEALRESGIPISMKRRLTNCPIDLEDEMEAVAEETVALALAKARQDLDTYKALRNEGLPIPPELRAMFEPKATGAEDGTGNPHAATEGAEANDGPAAPLLGEDDPARLTRSEEDLAAAGADGEAGDGKPAYRPRNWMQDKVQRSRPPESDEQRGTMPKKTASVRVGSNSRVGKKVEISTVQNGPTHVGLRRYAGIVGNKPLDEQVRGTSISPPEPAEGDPVDGETRATKG